jgi:hypothetical protein
VAAGVVDQLRCPVPGGERRIEPLERGDADRLGAADGEPHPVDSRGGVLDELHGGILAAGRLRQGPRVTEHLTHRVGIERDHLRPGLDLLRDRPDVIEGHRADRAQRLGDDQVRSEVAERVAVQLVDRLAGERSLLDGGVDLPRGQPCGQHVARDPGQLARGRRVVALVRDGDKVRTEAKREQHLGRRWDQAHDSHQGERYDRAAEWR